jgi:hypothetical protein
MGRRKAGPYVKNNKAPRQNGCFMSDMGTILASGTYRERRPAMQTAASPSSRTPAGRFAPGVSGNPAGRPKGARNRASLIEDALRDGEAEAIVRRMVELALDGDRATLRFCAERLLPRPKGRPVELDLAAGQESDPEAVIAAVLRAVADGEVTPDEAATIGRLVGQSARAAAARPAAAAPRRRDAAAATSLAAALAPAALPPGALPPAAPPVSGLFSGVSAAALLAAQGGGAAGARLNRAA